MSALAASDKGGLISRTLQGASVTLLVVNIALSTLVQCNAMLGITTVPVSVNDPAT